MSYRVQQKYCTYIFSKRKHYTINNLTDKSIAFKQVVQVIFLFFFVYRLHIFFTKDNSNRYRNTAQQTKN